MSKWNEKWKMKVFYNDDGLKRCPACKKYKYKDYFIKDKRCADGLGICKKCKKWQTIKSQYKITRKEFIELYIKQNKRCPITGIKLTSMKRYAIDHNHNTGKVRGIIDWHMNSYIIYVLEFLKDNPDIERKINKYLK